MAIVTEVFSKILECSYAPIKRHISYAFNFRSKVNKLGGEVKKLAIDKEQLELSVEGALRQGEEILNTVKDWQMRAGEAIKDAEELIEQGKEEAQKSRFARLCFNLKKCYDIGKKADKKTPDITQLHEERGGFVSISCQPRLRQIVKPPLEGYEAESRNKILKEVMDALVDSDVNMVGVYGMGGIGKTTLAKEVHCQAARDKLFEDVILATVTATPELRRVQGEIADILELKLDEETEVGRASRLYQKLKGRSILIILDDLWNMLELEKVGIPTGNNCKGCKILLTSRRLDVLSEMGSQKNFPVQLLSEEEAKNLFEIQVADVKDSKIEEEILLKCAGFPLLIVTVAGLLKNKDSHFWKCTLMQLSMFDDREIEAKVYSVLESSYNNLPDEDNKLIFLLSGICGRSNISIPNLLKYCLGLGLGLFKRCTVEMARSRLCKLMDDLKSSSLLLDIDKAGVVRMHDTVRDFALWMASRDRDRVCRVTDAANPLRVWPSRDELENCKIISLPSCDIKELPEDLYLGCPDAEFFLFSSIGDSLDISNISFEGIKLLKVLCFSGVCFSPVPRSFGFLTSLQTLCLDDCQLRDMAMIGQLRKLEILSFRRSWLESLPSEIGQLTKLKLLDLSYCYPLRVIPANVISKLSSLEELLMRSSFNEWEIEEHSNNSNARLTELESLSHLSSLEMHVPNAKALPRNLFSKHLERFQILIGDWDEWDWDEDYKRSKTLKFNTDTDVLDRVKILLEETEALYLGNMSRTMNVLPDVEIGGFSKLRELAIENCNKLKNIFNLSMIRSLSQLEKMEVSQCDGVEGIVVDDGDCEFDGNEVVEFSRLRTLELSSLPQLKGFIYKKKSSPVPETTAPRCSETTSGYELGTPLPLFDKMVAFPCLEELEVLGINNIGTVFPSGVSGRFQKLKSLAVCGCDLLEEIYEFQDLNVERPNEILKFELESLHLYNLSKLETVWRSSGRLFTFENLESIKADRCGALKNIFPAFIAKKFPQLKKLSVVSCGKLEEMVAREESVGSNIPSFSFPQLTSLQLEYLREMRGFYPGRHTLECPKLNDLTLRGCHKGSMLISESPSSGLHQTRGEGPHHDDKHFFLAEKIEISSLKLAIEWSSAVNDIWHAIFPSPLLRKITVIQLMGFPAELPLLPSGFLHSLPNLYRFVVRDSFSEIIFPKEVNTVEEIQPASPFAQLRILKLFNLPNLKHLVEDDSQLGSLFQHLEELQVINCGGLIRLITSSVAKGLVNLQKMGVEECERMTEIFSKEVNTVKEIQPASSEDDSQVGSLFRSLRKLEVIKCSRLTMLITSSTAKGLVNLQKMVVKECERMTEIVASEANEVETDVGFCELKYLKLHDLPLLTSFSSNCTLNFPILQEVIVRECPKMMIFARNGLRTPLLDEDHAVQIGEDEDARRWEGSLNTTIEKMFLETNVQDA